NATNDAYFSFQYHMLGATMGSIELQIQTDASPSWATIWNKSGPFGDIWTTAFVDLDTYTGQNIQLRFKTTTGSSYTGDIAIDDLSLETSAPPPVAGCLSTIHQFAYLESFETSFGGWVGTGSPSLWSRLSSSGADGLYIMRANGSAVVSTGGSASLESPCLDLSAAVDAFCSFQYLNYWLTSGVTASMSFQVSDDGGSTWTSIWNRSGVSGLLWSTANVDLGNYIGSTIQVRFVAEFGPNSAVDMFIDNFQLYAPTAPSTGNVSGQVLFAQTTSCPDASNNYCCDPQTITGLAMPNVGVKLIKGGNTVAALTDGTGTFSENLAAGDLSMETTVNTGSWNNGISISDVIALNNHVSGNKLINCPIQRLAADVDGDGDIDQDDANELNQMNLNNIPTFSGGDNWKFVAKNLIMPGDLLPDERFYADFWNDAKEDVNGSDYPFKAVRREMDGTNTSYTSTEPWYNHFNTYLNTNCNSVDFGFYGVKVGDINSSATHNTFSNPYAAGAARNTNDPNSIRQSQIALQRDEAELRSRKFKYQVKIVASVSEPVLGYQFSIAFDDEIVTLDKVNPNRAELDQSTEKNFGQAKKTLRGGSFSTQWITDFARESRGKGFDNIVLLSYEFKSDLPQDMVERAFSLDSADKEVQFIGKDGLIQDVDLQVFVEAIK
ncbi:MAG: hypothetical protein AAF242_01130, partial [Bacteroidota bacterium]